jgi:mono/diheme cytochrome c family protein
MFSSNSHPLFALPWYLQLGGALAAVGVLLGVQAGPDTMSSPSSPAAGHTADVVALNLADEGEQIYNTRCMSCHQMGGRGVPGTFPPLRDTDWVNGDKGRLIRMLLHGISGQIEVKGQTYSGVMPPWGGALDDEGIAAVSTYIRSNFGNDASAITAEEVAKVRAATKERKKPWTAKELKKEANTGIPGDSTATDG